MGQEIMALRWEEMAGHGHTMVAEISPGVLTVGYYCCAKVVGCRRHGRMRRGTRNSLIVFARGMAGALSFFKGA